MGQPQQYTSEQIAQALRDTNGLVSLAARRLGCSPNTIYARSKSVAFVKQVIDDSLDELVDIAELALRSSVTSKEPWAVALVLKTLGKNRGYVERQEVTGADNGPLQVIVKYANIDIDPTEAA